MTATGHSPPSRIVQAALVNARLGLDIFRLVRERIVVHRTVIERHLAALSAPAVEPAYGLLHPLIVVAVREVLMRVGAAAFLAVFRADSGYRRSVVWGKGVCVRLT